MLRWLRDCREALFGGKTRAPRDYKSRRRWVAQRILPLIRRLVYVVAMDPLDRLGYHLEHLSPIELKVIAWASRQHLGDNFVDFDYEVWPNPEDGILLESVTVRVRDQTKITRDTDDEIMRRAITAYPALSDAHFSLNIFEFEPTEAREVQ